MFVAGGALRSAEMKRLCTERKTLHVLLVMTWNVSFEIKNKENIITSFRKKSHSDVTRAFSEVLSAPGNFSLSGRLLFLILNPSYNFLAALAVLRPLRSGLKYLKKQRMDIHDPQRMNTTDFDDPLFLSRHWGWNAHLFCFSDQDIETPTKTNTSEPYLSFSL